MGQVYLNGEYLPRSEARLPVGDRGFLFGDGLYEVTRAVNGRLFEEEAHWRRLSAGLREISLDLAGQLDRERLRQISERLLHENALRQGHATVYLEVTRGATEVRTHWFPPEGTPPTIFLSAARFEIPGQARREGVAAITQPDIRWSRCDIKSVNLLPNVMAKQQARVAGAFEAIFLRDGLVTEGSSSNVFGVIDGVVRTHPLTHHILPGVTREVVFRLAAELGVRIEERPLNAEELPQLEELFATGTATDVQPIATLDGQRVGTGRPGPIALALQQRLERLLEG